MIKAVIFDVDGVIADTEEAGSRGAVNMFKELYGVEVKRSDFDPFVGTGAKNYISGVARKYGVNVDIERAIKGREEQFLKIAKAGGVRRFPGAIELIKEARDLGWKVAIATSSHKAKFEVTLKSANLDKAQFDVITTAEDCSALKPNPEIFLVTARKLGVFPGEAIVVEDSPAGVKAGKDGGFFVVGVASTFPKDKLQEADLVVDSLEGLSFRDLINVVSK